MMESVGLEVSRPGPVEVVMDESAKIVASDSGDLMQISLSPPLDDFFDELNTHKPTTYILTLSGSKRFDVVLTAQLVPRPTP
jgi:hypothetical protein